MGKYCGDSIPPGHVSSSNEMLIHFETDYYIANYNGFKMEYNPTGTVFPQIRPAAIIFSWGLQLQVLLEITKFRLHKSMPGAGIIRNAGIIPGRVLYEEIW